MVYAGVADYEARYGALGESEASRVELLLSDASMKIDALVEKFGIDADCKSDVLMAMCCEYVRYQMQFAVGSGVSAVTQQAGSFMETYTMRTELSFGKWALRYFGDALGIDDRGRASGVKIAIHDRSGVIADDLNAW